MFYSFRAYSILHKISMSRGFALHFIHQEKIFKPNLEQKMNQAAMTNNYIITLIKSTSSQYFLSSSYNQCWNLTWEGLDQINLKGCSKVNFFLVMVNRSSLILSLNINLHLTHSQPGFTVYSTVMRYTDAGNNLTLETFNY